MFSTLKMPASIPLNHRTNTLKIAGNLTFHTSSFSLPSRRLTVLSLHSSETAPSTSPELTSAVGSPSLQLNLSHRHIATLNVLACAVGISATWLFLSTIPALLAFKRAAESLEKLLDVTREELPDTMAAVRLSGMEISDLTMELSDLGQEITQGVKKSTRAVHMAEEKLRHFANMTSTGDNLRKNHLQS